MLQNSTKDHCDVCRKLSCKEECNYIPATLTVYMKTTYCSHGREHITKLAISPKLKIFSTHKLKGIENLQKMNSTKKARSYTYPRDVYT